MSSTTPESKYDYKERALVPRSKSSQHIVDLITLTHTVQALMDKRMVASYEAAKTLATVDLAAPDRCWCTFCNKDVAKDESKTVAKSASIAASAVAAPVRQVMTLVPLYRFPCIEGAGDYGGDGGSYPCDQCGTATGHVFLGLPGGSAAWSRKARCPECCKASSAGAVRYRIHAWSRCAVCHTDSISIRGTSAHDHGLRWEAFACQCEEARHWIYNGGVIMCDDQIHCKPDRGDVYYFYGESNYTPEKCVKELRKELRQDFRPVDV